MLVITMIRTRKGTYIHDYDATGMEFIYNPFRWNTNSGYEKFWLFLDNNVYKLR